MKDNFGRTINYLRLSITDRCNLRCRYCMPAKGITQQSCADILRYEEMLRIVAAATTLGIRKIRVTGGEPLVRKGAVGFLRQLTAMDGVEEVALTTNGMLLPDHAEGLRQAGLKRLNISLDSLQPETFAAITRGGDLQQVLRGIDSAGRAGLKIKLNMVVLRGVNDHEVPDFAALSLTHPWSVRFIEYMPTIREKQWQQRILSGAEILTRLRQRYRIEALGSERFCGPAKPYRIAGAKGTIGIITPMSEHFCSSCNRIRVSSTGLAKSCLMNDQAVDLRPCLNSGRQADLVAALTEIIQRKPEHHRLAVDTATSAPFSMASIGG